MVNMGTLQAYTRFDVVNNLTADIQPGTTYIDQCIEGIFPVDRESMPINQAPMDIMREDGYLSKISIILSRKACRLGPREQANIRVAKQLTVSAKSKSAVSVVTSRNGLLNIARIQTN